MQTVAAGWTAEERDTTRKIAQNLQVSWHKQSTLGNRTFTIGVSTIGGTGVIGANPGAVGSPSNYKYFDESQYVTSLAWERGLNMPIGGLTKALAEAHLDNTSGRFTPRFMGGRSELYTAIQPSKPLIINAGFNFGVDQTIPQFTGILNKQPQVDVRNGQVTLQAADYVNFFENKYLDQEVMFTSQRTDQVMSTLLNGTLGMSTAQYDLDTGINVIPFGLFESGTKMSDIFNQLVSAENGHFYQNEAGIFKFDNRQHWDSSPYTQVQRVITTSQVINASVPADDNIINVVEVRGKVIAKQPTQLVYSLSGPLIINGNSDTTMFVEFADPMLAVNTPSFYVANTLSDGSGTDVTTAITIKSFSKFARNAKIVFSNSTSQSYLTDLRLYGRPAKVVSDVYYRGKDDSSVTAYQERPLQIDNQFIQNQSWAQSLAQLVLNDYSDIENLQTITIRAVPELQLGDLISWQGRYWRVFNIRSALDPSNGFTQELKLVQKHVVSYFRIGISTIGGTDRIAP